MSFANVPEPGDSRRLRLLAWAGRSSVARYNRGAIGGVPVDRGRRGHRTQVWAGFIGVESVGIVLYLSGAAAGFGVVLYGLIAAVAVGAIATGTTRYRPQDHRAWNLLAAAVALMAIGDTVDLLATDGEPVSAAAVAISLAGYAILVVAIYRVAHGVHRFNRETLLDAAIVGIAAGMAVWFAVVQPGLQAASPADGFLTLVATTADIVAVAILLPLLWRRETRSASLGFLLLAFVALPIANMGNGLAALTAPYAARRVFEAATLLGYVAIAAAALQPSMTRFEQAARAPDEDALDPARLAMLGVALLVCPGIFLLHELGGITDQGLLVVALGSLAIVAVVAVRLRWSAGALLASERRVQARERMLLETQRIAHVGSWERKLATGAITVSDETLRICGLDRVAFDGTPHVLHGLIHPEDRELAIRDGAASGADRLPAIEYRIVRPDGSTRIVHEEVDLVRDDAGTLIRYVGSLQDVTERVEAERETTRLGAVVDAMRDFVATATPDGRVVHLNPAGRALVGLPSDADVDSLSVRDFLTEDGFVQSVTVERPAVLRDGRWTGMSKLRHFETGEAIPVEVESFLIRDPVTGSPQLIGTIQHDITERQTRESHLRRLAAVIEDSPDGVVITDLDQRITYANRAFAAGVGREPSDLVGRPVADHAARVLDPAALADLVRTVGDGRRFESEVEHRDPDGTTRRIDVGVRPMFGASGEILGWAGILRDVTDLRRGEAERTRLATAIEQSADAIVITDADARIEYVNPAFERVTGYTLDEVRGQNPRILSSGVQGPAFYGAMWATLTSGHSFTADITNRRKDGTLFTEDAVISPVVGADGTTTGYVAVKRDVTAERAAEATRERVARERALIVATLTDLRAGPTPEATADAVCRHVVRLAAATTATLYGFAGDGRATPLAFARADGVAVPLRPLPARRSEALQERAAGGPWVEAWVQRPWHPYDRLFRELGVTASGFAPVRHGQDLLGLLVITSSDPDGIAQLTETLPSVLEFAAVAGALVGPAMLDRTEVGRVRAHIAGILATGAFHPVFQPIVELGTGKTVGYEALTRFDSGQRPDLCFADAWSVGLGAKLEIATLEAAVAAARELPAGTWLSLNVSPGVVADSDRVRVTLSAVDRPIILEITEHEVIKDYAAVREAIRSLGPDVRLAVDDAGAGIANFGHIVELRPNLVKLDIGLVRAVNTDLGRQAMVVAMRHFSLETGCRLVAEGVETQAEANTLLALHVELAQGYLFGRPEPAGHWIAASPGHPPGAGSRRRRPTPTTTSARTGPSSSATGGPGRP